MEMVYQRGDRGNPRRFKPVAYARQEDFDALVNSVNALSAHLHGDLEDFERGLAIFETALLSVLQDVEAMSDALVGAGILESEDDVEEPPAEWLPEDYDEDPTAIRQEADEDREEIEAEADALEQQLAPGGEKPEESPASRAARIEEVRARRAAAIQEQGVKAFEEGNETPEAAMTDPNDIMDVPEEGITVDEGKNPFGGLQQ